MDIKYLVFIRAFVNTSHTLLVYSSHQLFRKRAGLVLIEDAVKSLLHILHRIGAVVQKVNAIGLHDSFVMGG